MQGDDDISTYTTEYPASIPVRATDDAHLKQLAPEDRGQSAFEGLPYNILVLGHASPRARNLTRGMTSVHIQNYSSC